MTTESRLDSLSEWIEARLPAGWEWELKFRTGTECAWEAEVRLTPLPNVPDGPDVSTVLFVGGGVNPEELAGRIESAIRMFVQTQ